MLSCESCEKCLTCCGDRRSNRRGLDWEIESPVAVVSTEWALTASASDSGEGWVERSRDGILP